MNPDLNMSDTATSSNAPNTAPCAGECWKIEYKAPSTPPCTESWHSGASLKNRS